MKLLGRGPEPALFSSVPFLAARASVEQQLASGTIPDFHRFVSLMPQIREALIHEFGSRCVYCRSLLGSASVGHVLNFFPKSQYPSRAFTWGNLLLLCEACSIARGPKFPLAPNSEPLLLDPTVDALSDHVAQQDDGTLVGRSERGVATIEVYNLNRPGLVVQRNEERAKATFDGDISEDAITAWMAQFDESARPVASRLLSHFKYYSPRRMGLLLQDLHRKILESVNVLPDRLWFVPVGYVAKSGAAVAYFYRKENKIQLDRFVATNDLPRIPLAAGDAIVVLDDYIGSGHQAVHIWESLIAPLFGKEPSAAVVFAAAIGNDTGIEHIRQATSFIVVVADMLTSADRPLSPDSHIFPTESERQDARSVLERYGRQLLPKHPLGYAESQALLGFFYSTPNNTLPIFWASSATWNPLVPRGESFRDPEALVGPPVSLSAGTGASAIRRPLVEVAELDSYDISPEVTTKLLAEFKLLPVVLLVAPVLKTLGVKDSVLAKFLEIVATLKYLQHEKESVRSALLLVGDSGLPGPDDFIFAGAPGQAVDNQSEIRSLVQLVDGLSGGTVIRSNGDVLGSIVFPNAEGVETRYLAERYLGAAAASRKFGGLLFLFAGAGRASLFNDGRRIAVHRNAAWHYQPTALAQGVLSLTERHRLAPETLGEVLNVAYALSDSEHGALITVGDSDAVIGLSERLKSGHIIWGSSRFCVGTA